MAIVQVVLLLDCHYLAFRLARTICWKKTNSDISVMLKY